MADAPHDPPHLTPESVGLLAEAAGIEIAAERLPDVTTVLTELFALGMVLDELDLAGVDPDMDEAQWPTHHQQMPCMT